jgi:hypothetical protein
MHEEIIQPGGISLLGTTPKIIRLPTVVGDQGDLTVAERLTLGFDVARVYYLYNLSGARRGGHAHKLCQELIVAVSGRFLVNLEAQDGSKANFTLSQPSLGLYIPALYWRLLSNFSRDAICLVLASESYREDEYLRNHDEFRSYEPL